MAAGGDAVQEDDMAGPVVLIGGVSERRRAGARPRRTTEIANLFPRQGEWTEADYLSLPETNRIVELSDGRAQVPDMPGTSHQRAVRDLLWLFESHIRAGGLGEVCTAPLRVRLWPGKFREPDIVFMRREHSDRITEEHWGVPDLVVEVISPRTPQSSGTEGTDRGDKFLEYARSGVEEYWLVDLVAPAIEVYGLRAGTYHLLGRWGKGEMVTSQVITGLAVPVDAVLP